MKKGSLIKRTWKRLGALLIVIGVLILAYPFSTNIYTLFHQNRLKEKWSKMDKGVKATPKKFSAKKREEPQENRVNLSLGSPMARLVIPKISLDTIVVEGAIPATLRRAPGHIAGTALPGEKGNVVISGHRTTYGGPFRNLNYLDQGDVIYLYSPYKKYAYYVSASRKKVVKPTDLTVTRPTEEPILTLTTCNPLYSAKERLVIVAEL